MKSQMLSDRFLRFFGYMVMGMLLLVVVTTIVIPIIFRSATVSVATREQDAPTLSLMVFIWNDYKVTSSSLPPLKAHPLPPTLAQWETVSEVGDYFSEVEESPLGYLVWSEFPVNVYLDQSKNDEKWLEAVETAVQEWDHYLPLQLITDRAAAHIIIARSRPPLNTTRNPETGLIELSRARSARTRYEFALQSTSKEQILIHRMKIEISPDQSQKHTLATARHEIGHGLGIWGHSPHPEDALYFSQVRDSPPISDRDINTLKRIYQQPTRLGHPID